MDLDAKSIARLFVVCENRLINYQNKFPRFAKGQKIIIKFLSSHSISIERSIEIQIENENATTEKLHKKNTEKLIRAFDRSIFLSFGAIQIITNHIQIGRDI